MKEAKADRKCIEGENGRGPICGHPGVNLEVFPIGRGRRETPGVRSPQTPSQRTGGVVCTSSGHYGERTHGGVGGEESRECGGEGLS